MNLAAILEMASVLFILDFIGFCVTWKLADHLCSRAGRIITATLMIVFGYLLISDMAQIGTNETTWWFVTFPWRDLLWRIVLVGGLAWALRMKHTSNLRQA